jgi:[glutamine synthetase] adenylyltransferase / [glutamine synthetase]-adenylyl-L-tyrosine phosphorylase
MRREFSAVGFHDPRKAEGNLTRVEERLAPELMAPLASLLTQSPDPDGALNLLDRYVHSAPPEVLAELPSVPSALTYLVAIFGYSGYLAETFLAEPTLPLQFARDRHFAKLKSREDLMQDYARFATTSPDHWLSAQLARFKRRNYLRIVLKDVLGLSTLGETTLELSALADVILANALIFCDQELEKRYGQPQFRDPQGRIARAGFAILSLGKLGGNELNYSSDIDLLFLYSHDGETSGSTERDSAIANKEYFVRLAHAITRTITQTTPYGQVFRVDLRLRPEGEQGDLAISVRSALEYYEHRARDWELQMLIKARYSAGESRITREFLRGVEPYVYGAPADFSAIESVLLTRERISKKLRESRSNAIDVKLHRGGIRDIEFLSQCLQRLYGGGDPWVRAGGTLHGLRKLNDKGLLSDRDYAALTTSYELLRRLEHRIQLDMGQQSHRLPSEPEAVDRMARRMGIANAWREPPKPQDGAVQRRQPGRELIRLTERAFARVDEIYQRAIHPRATPEAKVAFALQPLPPLPGDHGPHSYESILQFLDAQAPEVSRPVRETEVPERARQNVAHFLATLLSSSERFRVVREQPLLVRRAVEVIGASDYFASLLIHHPEDLAAWGPVEAATTSLASSTEGLATQTEMVLDPVPAPGSALVAAAASNKGEAGGASPGRYSSPPVAGVEPFAWAAERGLDTREKMALLRRRYRSQVLTLGAQDLARLDSIFFSLQRWSRLAAQSVSSALSIAVEALRPAASLKDRVYPLAVLGLGRLGLNEFDLGSDVDLLFVAASGTSRDELAEWTPLAEKTIEVLSSYTRDGTLFAVDTRLRPQGREGELVITADELLSYVAEHARSWEALTYLKAAPVAGAFNLGLGIVARLVGSLLERFGNHESLEEDLRQMRRRLEREVDVRPTDTKTAPGGYYDVDFCVSYLRLRRRLVELPVGANTIDQVGALRAVGLLQDEDARTLTEGATFLRSLDHAIRLVTGRPAEGLPEHVGQAESVESLTRRWGIVKAGETLAGRLRQTQDEVRSVYRRLVGAD